MTTDATDANIFTEVGDLRLVGEEEEPSDCTDGDLNEVELDISGSDHDSCTPAPKSPRDKDDRLETFVTASLSKLPEVRISCCAESRCVGVRHWRAFPAVGAICLRLVVWTCCGWRLPFDLSRAWSTRSSDAGRQKHESGLCVVLW